MGSSKSAYLSKAPTLGPDRPLYQIDPAPYQAAYDQARGLLHSALANVVTAKAKEERYAGPMTINGVARQDYDDANATYLQARAAVDEDRAALQTAKINLSYTRIISPISGRIGRSAFTQDALVIADKRTR